MIPTLFLLLAFALTPEEEAAVASRQVAVREEGSSVYGVMDVKATPKETLKAVLDVKARVSESDELESAEIYLDQPGKLGCKYTMSLAGLDVVFHILYTYDLTKGIVSYDLDPSKENDIDEARGTYTATANAAGTRLVYKISFSGASGWLRKSLTSSGLPGQMEGIRKRAESGRYR